MKTADLLAFLVVLSMVFLSSCGGGGVETQGGGVAGDSSTPACDGPYYRQMLGAYDGNVSVSNWGGSTKEVLENTCTWDVSLRFYEVDSFQDPSLPSDAVDAANNSHCSIKGRYSAELIAHDNYSSAKIFGCLKLDSTFSLLGASPDDYEFLNNPRWPMSFNLLGGTQPIPSSQNSGVQYVTPLTGEDKTEGNQGIKKEDGNIFFRTSRSDISIEGVLRKQ